MANFQSYSTCDNITWPSSADRNSSHVCAAPTFYFGCFVTWNLILFREVKDNTYTVYIKKHWVLTIQLQHNTCHTNTTEDSPVGPKNCEIRIVPHVTLRERNEHLHRHDTSLLPTLK
jgi:hypothetical protein